MDDLVLWAHQNLEYPKPVAWAKDGVMLNVDSSTQSRCRKDFTSACPDWAQT